MRILILIIVVALSPTATLCSDVQSDIPSIAVGNATVDAHGAALLNLAFSAGGQEIAGIQLDLVYENQAMDLTVIPGPATGDSSKRIWTSDPQSSVKRILIVGMNQDTILDGVLATLSVQISPDALPGLHPLLPINLIVTGPNGNGQTAIAGVGGVLVRGTAPVSPVVRAATNAASYAAGTIAPGEIIVLWGESLGEPGEHPLQLNEDGRLSNVIDGTRVFFDGVPAPLLYVTPNQVSAIVPKTVAGHSEASLRVEWQGVLAPPFILAVSRTALGVFTLDQSGAGQGAVVNEDGTVNGRDNPAIGGTVVSIYGTGQGLTVPAGVEGAINSGLTPLWPLLPIKVWIGGQQAELLYAGSAPGQVPGLLQLNARIPEAVTPGPAVPIVLTAETSSQTGVTMAIR